MRSRIGLMLAKVESAYGSEPTPTTAADAIVVFEPEITPEIDANERKEKGISLSNLKELSGKSRCKLSFTCELKGSGTAGVAPRGLGALLKACAMSETIVSATSVTYAPASSSLKSCTIWQYMDGKCYKINGCVGSWELDLKSGETPKIKFELSGLYATPTDIAMPASATYDSTSPVVCKNLTATLDSYAAVIREISLKMNNKITERGNLASTTGIAGFDVTDRDPEGEISLEATLLATHNWYTKFEADTVQVLSVAITGAAGNICTITASQCRLRQIPEKDEDGIMLHNIPFQMARNTGNDEISIVLT